MDENISLSKEERDKLIIDNLPLVNAMINKYVYIGDDELDDLEQVGKLYLTLAAYKFKPSLGIKFSTYACNYILHGIRHYRRSCPNKYRGLHIGRNDLELMYKIAKYTKDSTIITKEEKEIISKELNIDKSKIDKLCISITSLDEKVDNNDGDELNKVFNLGCEEHGYNNILTAIEITRLLDIAKQTLKTKDYNIIKDLVYEYVVYREKVSKKRLAERHNVCEATVRRAINRFKKIYNERKDK